MNESTTIEGQDETRVDLRVYTGGKFLALDAVDTSERFKATAANIPYKQAHALADWIIANVPKPEPIWHSAKPGEVGELTYGGQPTAHVYTDRWAGEGYAFVSDRAIVSLDDPDITSGRRIWPEGVED